MYSLVTLKYAAAAHRLGSLSAAAREHGVKQPTVSAAITELEAALGTALFVRGARQLQLTAKGGLLMPRIESVLAAVAELSDEAARNRARQQRQLRIGFTPLMGANRLGILLDPLREQRTDTDFIFYESTPSELEKRLDAGSLDVIVGVGFAKNRQRRRAVLFREPLCFIARSSAPSSRPRRLKVNALHGARLLMTEDLCGLASATRKLLEENRVKVDEYAGRAISYGALEDWVDLGLGGAILPRSHVRGKGNCDLLVDPTGNPMSLTMEAVWRKDFGQAEPAAKLLVFLNRVAPQLASGLG